MSHERRELLGVTVPINSSITEMIVKKVPEFKALIGVSNSDTISHCQIEGPIEISCWE